MVPGMTERDRLVADAQRLDWLADAVVGPARKRNAPHHLIGSDSQLSERLLGCWRERFVSALTQLRRIRPLAPNLGGSPPSVVAATGR